MVNPRTIVIGVPAALLLAAGAIGSQTQPIRIAGSSWVADAPTKVADALDLFTGGVAQPIVRVDAYNSGQEALESLLAGDAEFALAASTPVARALLDAADGSVPRLAVLAAISLSNRTHVVIADAAAGIEQPADLRGRRIGVTLGTSAHFGWHQFARHLSLTHGDVTLIDIPVHRQLDALLAGEIDAVSNWDPWSTRTGDRLGDRTRVFSTRHLHTVSWLLVTRETTLAMQPEVAERVLRGYAEAMRIIDEEPARAMQLHAAATATDVDVLAEQVVGILWGLRLDWPVIADLETQFQWLIDSGDRPARPIPAPDDYLYAAPLQAAHPRGITLPRYFFADRRDEP